jgi:hypothetical protein
MFLELQERPKTERGLGGEKQDGDKGGEALSPKVLALKLKGLKWTVKQGGKGHNKQELTKPEN